MIDILESNKKIAEFMGYEYYTFNQEAKLPCGWIKKGQQNHPGLYKMAGLYLCRTSKDLPYRNNWNYLMGVVSRLEEKYGCYMHIRCNSVSIDNGGGFYRELRDKTKLELVFQAVDEFITWYNEQDAKDVEQ